MNQEIIQKAPGDFTWSLFGKYKIFNKLYFTVTSPWGCEANMLRVRGDHAPGARLQCLWHKTGVSRVGGRAGPMQRFGAGVHLILGAAKVRFMENDYLCGLAEKHLQNIR